MTEQRVEVQWWEVTFYDETTIDSTQVALPEDIPDEPILVVVQLGYTAPEYLVNGARYYFDVRYGWMEMENDSESLGTKLRKSVKYWTCYRPGWWLEDRERFKQLWTEARARLEEVRNEAST